MGEPGTAGGVLRLLLAASDRQICTRLGIALVAVAGAGVLTALAPLALKHLVDSLAATPMQSSTALPDTFRYTALYVAALCMGRLLNELRPLLMGAAEQRLHGRLTRHFFAHVLALPFPFHVERKTGGLAHTLSQISSASKLILSNLVQGVPLLIELVTVIVVLSQLGQPELVAIFIASAVAYAGVYRDGTRRVRRRSREVSAAATAVHAKVADSLLNVETIKSFNARQAICEGFHGLVAVLESSWLNLHGQRMKLGLAAASVFAVALTSSFIVTVGAVQRGTLSIGGFVLATVYMLQMVRPIETLGAALRDIGQAMEFVRPALETLRMPAEADDARQPSATQVRVQPERRLAIRICRLKLAYPGCPPILDGVDLHVPAGTSLAIVGPSGSGKSSLARALLGLIDCEAGQILFDDRPADSLSLVERRSMISVVAQDVLLFDDSIAMNVAIGRPGATRAEVEAACRAARIHELIESLPQGYGTRVGERGLKLSGGERQRLAIARALIRQSALYVFDEATSALDARTEADVMTDLRKACIGRTTIFITHRLQVARHADAIAVLQDGHVQECGTHSDLMALGGAYARLSRLQAQHGTPAEQADEPLRA